MGNDSYQPWLYLMILGIILYAVGYYVASNIFNLGFLQGARAAGVLGHFYASAVIYTSLGLGDVLPNGHLRFIAGIEALNGLLLIAWSASFLFDAMGRFWHCLTGTIMDHCNETATYNNKVSDRNR